MARRPGFTLVEVLTVLAVLAVLLALLLPVISSVRTSALKVVCASRLRDLTQACNEYRLANNDQYPVQPGTRLPPGLTLLPNVTLPIPRKPSDMDAAFLNALQPYLKFPAIDPSASPEDLPQSLQCPTLEDEAGRIVPAEITLTRPALYTGYAYCVRPKDATLSPLTKLLKPNRVAALRMSARAVVWADDVQWSVLDRAYSFAHGVPGARTGPTRLSFARPAELLGQHRAYNDSSVEWVEGHEIDLNAQTQGEAATKASLSVFDMFFYWF
jgi:prepilin-type N-terminal cleavage/methylation domain-containing protein